MLHETQGEQNSIYPRPLPKLTEKWTRSDGGSKTYEARIASDAATRHDAYRLRYQSYHSQGYIPANPDRLFKDQYDGLPTATTVVVYSEGRAVASVRTCMLRSGAGTVSPARDAYPDEVEAILQQAGPSTVPGGYAGVETNRLVRAPEAEDDQGLVFMLYRLAGRMALQCEFRVFLCCVRRNHAAFYRRVGFQDAGAEPKIYPGLTCPMTLMISPRADWDKTRARFALLNPDAGPAGLLEGLETGQTVYPSLRQPAFDPAGMSRPN